MPRGVPRFGQSIVDERAMPEKILGTMPIDSPKINPDPEGTVTTWTREDGSTIELKEPPPPWEQHQEGFSDSDARRFVECPPNWRLFWLNPRKLDSLGWRDWQAVMASDPRVKLRVDGMKSPEGYVRRGGPGGDILCWMWAGWYESRVKNHLDEVARRTAAAVDKQNDLKDQFAGGRYPGVTLDSVRHPSHTQADGRTMRDA